MLCRLDVCEASGKVTLALAGMLGPMDICTADEESGGIARAPKALLKKFERLVGKATWRTLTKAREPSGLGNPPLVLTNALSLSNGGQRNKSG